MAPFELSDPSGVWSGWNWVEADGSQHAQYGSVQALDKSYPYAASQLTVKFQARAASTAGVHASAVEISADNFGVAPQAGVAPVVVERADGHGHTHADAIGHRHEHRHGHRTPTPTATATPSQTPTATDTSEAPSPTPTATDTPDAAATPTDTPDVTATPTPTWTPTSD